MSKATLTDSVTVQRRALSGWPMILVWLGMLIFAFHACTHMVAAGDTWVAMACGRHFINHGVDTVEPFSANSHKPGPTPEEVKKWPKWAQVITDKVGLETVKKYHPTGWVNQNWLTHVIFYWLTTTIGSEENPHYNALVYWKFAIYIIAVICVFYTGILLGANPALSGVFACFAMFVGRSLLDVRPAGFSNVLVAVFLLILVLTTYRNYLYVWLLVPLAVFWCNVHGGYIYAFIMLVPFAGLHLLTACPRKVTAILYNVIAWPFYFLVVFSAGLTMATLLFFFLLIVLDILLCFFGKSLVSIGRRGVCHTIAAGFVAFVAMVLFNPFHLTNLTHTFVISVSKHAERWRDIHEWHPAFEWTNPVGTAKPFLVMYIIAWLALIIWAVVLIKTSRSVRAARGRRPDKPDDFKWPEIDLPLILIAALTIYMAIRSRRFIPIAGVAACPILAMFIDQIIRAISAAGSFHRSKRLVVSPMPQSLRLPLGITGVVLVLFFGIWWGLRFKRVYLDPWPNDPDLDSVFMRMTASDAKPFYAGRFIRDNKLKGKMFNYWTEGGFLAFAQEPDPNTGRTPLQLFMDGRAQAAYNVETFDVWLAIMSGGPTVQAARERARATGQRVERVMTSADYRKTGDWISGHLRERDAWVVVMPALQFDQPIVRGLEHSPQWRLVFFNNKQKILVDGTTPQGRELFTKVLAGQAVYSDEFSGNLIAAHNAFLFGRGRSEHKHGFQLLKQALQMKPSPTPMLELIIIAARLPEVKADVEKLCKDFVDDYAKNRAKYSRQCGYRLRTEAVQLAYAHLQKAAQTQGDTDLTRFYGEERKKCLRERNRLSEQKRW